MRALFVFLILSLFSFGATYAVAVEEPLADPAQEAAARALMKEIRCLVCQNQSIEDSDADLARDLRVLVRERVALGDNAEAVKAFLVARYGDWVLLAPPIKPETYFLWASPFVLLAVAGFVMLRRRAPSLNQTLAHAGEPSAPLSNEEQARLAALLADNSEPSEEAR